MMAIQTDTQRVRMALEHLQALVEQLRGEFVSGINTPADYARATALLDELTDGHVLSKYEDNILIELEDALLVYERDAEQFAHFNATIGAPVAPLELLRNLMEIHGLSGSELPEIGDKTAVSKVLNGSRPISHKMAYALSARFAMQPGAFID